MSVIITNKTGSGGFANPMTTGGDIIIGGASGVPTRLANGSAFNVLQANGGTSAETWVNPGVKNVTTVNNAASPYTILSTDDVLAVDGTSGVTLTPLTLASRVFQVTKTDATTGVVTITGVTTLSTQSESVTYYYTGSVYVILSRYIPGGSATYTPTLGSAFGTTSSAFITRFRNTANLFVQGTLTAGTTAAGFYSITLPTGLTIDTGRIAISNTTSTAGQNIGFWTASGTTGGNGSIVTALGTSTSTVYFGGGTGGSATNTPFSGSGLIANASTVAFYFTVPITGWNS